MKLLAPLWLAATSGVAVALLVAFGWRLEVAARRAAWRRGALALMGLSHWLLVVQPAVRSAAGERTALLITERASVEALARLPEAWPRLALRGAPAGSGEPVGDVEGAVRRFPEVETWQIAGTGVARWELEHLPGEVSLVAPAEPRQGIDRADWPRRIALGESLEVRGSVRLAADVEGWLRLIGPAGKADEVMVTDGAPYRLAATPRQTGRFLFRLELTAGDTVFDEPVDVEVMPRRPPRVLWLEAAPSFESREIKAWLRDLGGELVVRSQISRGRYRYEYVNRERGDFGRLTPEVLEAIDLLVVDGPAWAALRGSEVAGVEQAVGEGLGLLLVPPVSGSVVDGPAGVSFAVAGVGDLDSFEVEVEGPGLVPLAPLTLPARQLDADRGQRTLVTDRAGRALALMAPLGAGRVGVTLVTETFRWPLRGEAASHRAYWSHLLSPLARTASSPLAVPPAGPLRPHEPATVSLLGEAVEPVQWVDPEGNAMPLAPAQDLLEGELWHATLWPRHSGWHRLRRGDDDRTAVAFFVGATSDWAAHRQRQALEATRRRAILGPAGGPVAAAFATERQSPWRLLPRWPVFLALLAAWGALWIDEQWRGRVAAARSGATGV